MRAKLPLDSRWSLRDRKLYNQALRTGNFVVCLGIVRKHMTKEEIEASNRRAEELAEIFGVRKPGAASTPAQSR